MNCEDVRPLLGAHADNELDLVREMELEAHLQTCPECTQRAQALAASRQALRNSLPRFTAPGELRQKIVSSLRAEAAPSVRTASGRRQKSWSWGHLGGLAASLAAALVLGYSWGNRHASKDSLLDEAVADHVRSLQVGHLMDVVSTDQHTVKPWFIGKLDFSPPVVDLSDLGFPLAGGRLERLDGQAAAALVFHRRRHSINLFVWPTAQGSVPNSRGAKDGYHVESWSQGGLNFLAVSEIPEVELEQFIREYRDRTK
jgi:anti-sigma factor RsiW